MSLPANLRRQQHDGMCAGDVVVTPTGKRAVLHKYHDGYWTARYLGEQEHTGGVVLQPKHIHLADDGE